MPAIDPHYLWALGHFTVLFCTGASLHIPPSSPLTPRRLHYSPDSPLPRNSRQDLQARILGCTSLLLYRSLQVSRPSPTVPTMAQEGFGRRELPVRPLGTLLVDFQACQL